ncbi:molybdopterin-guanine dinucleotide biosynthesis protein B [Campylobacter sp. LR264d]|uniref:molybdopterin-guanine dinucleotide biosynthesis protein B n=1 Tax=Campylobacter sp. LR264d TaxID=2593544 RepID=UPI001239F6EA|nr:molybdopterin-guanine dinucleotide biosynthesis protein B [Campylobacter sp. LR264d]KAA6230530.1 molybdopterin-guanine dinucleotide biosynthesis protein B [Campylobacter sp. LR264d]
MKKLVMAFSGPSNSGKTTLISKLSTEFINQGLELILIKHDPSDKAVFDKNGKDSFKFFQSGADVMVLSPNRTTYFSHTPRDVLSALKMVDDFDLCLVEGLKTLDLPRISVFCKDIDESYFSFSQAIASYEKIENDKLAWLYIDDIKGICEYILKNAKSLKGEVNG